MLALAGAAISQGLQSRFDKARVLANPGLRAKVLRKLAKDAKLAHQIGLAGDCYYFAGTSDREEFRWDAAIECFKDATNLYRQLEHWKDSGFALHQLGLALGQKGTRAEAVKAFTEALVCEEKASDDSGREETLTALALVYDDLGERGEAFATLKRAIQPGSTPNQRAIALNYRGRIFAELGQEREALDDYQNALTIFKEVGNRLGEAQSLHNIGLTTNNLGDPDKALSIYREAIPLWGNDRPDLAYTLNAVGKSYKDLKKFDLAIGSYRKSLRIAKQSQNRALEALLDNNIGRALVEQGKFEAAMAIYEDSLCLSANLQDFVMRAETLKNCALVLQRQRLRPLALVFAEESVRICQRLRNKIKTMPRASRASYVQVVTPTYRLLADLLISERRIPEAERVLGLLKDEEIFDYSGSYLVRGAAPSEIEKLGIEGKWWAQWLKLEKGAHQVLTEESNLNEEADRLTLSRGNASGVKRRLTDLAPKVALVKVALAAYFKAIATEIKKGDARLRDEIAKRESGFQSHPRP